MLNITESMLNGTNNTQYDTNDKNLTDLAKIIGIGIFSSLLGVSICVGNILVLLAVATTPCLRNTTNYLIVNLACADLCLGVVILPLTTLTYVYSVWPFGGVVCTMWQVLDITLTSASILTLGTISIDRYISLTKPLRYNSIVTTNRTVISILVVWIWSFGFALPLISQKPSNGNDESQCHSANNVWFVIFSVLVTFYIPSVIVVAMYIKIYRIARSQYKRDLTNFLHIQQQNICSSTDCHTGEEEVNSNVVSAGDTNVANCSSAPVRDTNVDSKKRKELSRIKTENKTLKTLGKVVGLFMFCWLPFFTIYPIAVVCKSCTIPPQVTDVAFWLGYCNSMVNPIIYAFSNVKFRYAFLRLVCCKRRTGQIHVGETSSS